MSASSTLPVDAPSAFSRVQGKVRTAAERSPPGAQLNKAAIAAVAVFGAAMVSLAVWSFSPVGGPGPAPVPPRATLVSARPNEAIDAGVVSVAPEGHPVCLMKFTSDPEAEVSIDGGVLGTTPLRITLPVGPVTVAFSNKKLGLHKLDEFIVPALPQASHVVEFRRGWIEVDAPDGTSISVDGRAVGVVPLKPIQVYEGRHTVDARLLSGKRQSGSVEVQANQTVTHFITAPRTE